MTVIEHGSLDIQKLLQVVSEILSDRYGMEVVVNVSTSGTVWSSGENVENTKIWR